MTTATEDGVRATEDNKRGAGVGGDETVGVTPATTTTPFHRGAPATVGVPTFIVGSVALGLHLINYVPSAGTSIAIIFAATGVGQLLACLWGIGLGESVVASIFGIFTGFWLCYAVLVLGLAHNWFGITKSDVTHTVALFLISWIVVVGLLLLRDAPSAPRLQRHLHPHRRGPGAGPHRYYHQLAGDAEGGRCRGVRLRRNRCAGLPRRHVASLRRPTDQAKLGRPVHPRPVTRVKSKGRGPMRCRLDQAKAVAS